MTSKRNIFEKLGLIEKRVKNGGEPEKKGHENDLLESYKTDENDNNSKDPLQLETQQTDQISEEVTIPNNTESQTETTQLEYKAFSEKTQVDTDDNTTIQNNDCTGSDSEVSLQPSEGFSEMEDTQNGQRDTTVEELSSSVESSFNNASKVIPQNTIKGEIKKSEKIDNFLKNNADAKTVQTTFEGDNQFSSDVGKDLLATKSQVVNNITEDDVEKKLDAMIESYERNKFLSIEDIYRKVSLTQDIKSTVFMVDVYAKALPENLPLDIKRESVLNIMKASDLEVNELLGDAYMRIDALNKVLEDVVNATEEFKVKNVATIKDLERRIVDLKKSMQEREKFQENQNTVIEYEIQRIINIVEFVKPK